MSVVNPETLPTDSLTTTCTHSKYTFDDLNALNDRTKSYLSPLATIGLIDMNAFFAQVEQVRLQLSPEDPVVCAQWGSLIAVSYAARKYGINRMDNIASAREKCPGVILAHAAVFKKGESNWSYQPGLPNRHNHKVSLDPYRRESRKIIRVLQSHCDLIEKASVDEFYLDFGRLIYKKLVETFPDLKEGVGSLPQVPTLPRDFQWVGVVIKDFDEMKMNEQNATDDLFRAPINDWDDVCTLIGSQIVYELRSQIYKQLGYTTSAGVARTKTLAKVAAGFKKPDNQTIVRVSSIYSFLRNFELTDFTGMGGKGGGNVLSHFDIPPGVNTISYIRENITLEELEREVPDLAKRVYDIVRGDFRGDLTNRVEVKSMMSRKNFVNKNRKYTLLQDIYDWIQVFAGDLYGRMVEYDDENKSSAIIKRPRTLSIGLITSSHGSHSRQMVIPVYTSLEKLKQVISENAFQLFEDLAQQLGDVSKLNGGKSLPELRKSGIPLHSIKVMLIINMGVSISNFVKISSVGMIDNYGAKADMNAELKRMLIGQEQEDTKKAVLDKTRQPTHKEIDPESKKHIEKMFSQLEEEEEEKRRKRAKKPTTHMSKADTSGASLVHETFKKFAQSEEENKGRKHESTSSPKHESMVSVQKQPRSHENATNSTLVHETFVKFHAQDTSKNSRTNKQKKSSGHDILSTLKNKQVKKPLLDELIESGICSICNHPIDDPIEHNDFHVALDLSKKIW